MNQTLLKQHTCALGTGFTLVINRRSEVMKESKTDGITNTSEGDQQQEERDEERDEERGEQMQEVSGE